MKKLLSQIRLGKYGWFFSIGAVIFLAIGGILSLPELQPLAYAASEHTSTDPETPAYVFLTYFLLAFTGIVIGILFRNALYVAVGISCMIALTTIDGFWGSVASILLSGYGIWLFISFSIFLAYYRHGRK